MGEPKIQVAQPRYGSTVGFRGMTDIPYCSIVIVIDYLAVRSGSALGDCAVISGMYGTHLKYGQCPQLISFNNLGSRLTHVIGVVWDASITSSNWCSLTY